MPRPNYMVAWTNLQEIIASALKAGVRTIDTGSILCLMLNLEHPGLDWSKLDEILQHLKAPTRH